MSLSLAFRTITDFETLVVVDKENAIGALNGKLDPAGWSKFWLSNPWEFDDNVPVAMLKDDRWLSEAFQSQRDVAFARFQDCVNEWIASGRGPDGSERASDRSYLKSPNASAVAARFWNTSRMIMVFPGGPRPDDWMIRYPGLAFHQADSPNLGRLIHLPPEEDGYRFDFAEWKIERLVATLLSTNWRFSIARCRKCQTYFHLDDAQKKKLFKRGTFCSVAHRQSFSAELCVKNSRATRQEKSMTAAVTYLLAQNKTDISWFDDLRFKMRLLEHVNKHRLKNQLKRHLTWITCNEEQIAAEANKQRAIVSPH